MRRSDGKMTSTTEALDNPTDGLIFSGYPDAISSLVSCPSKPALRNRPAEPTLFKTQGERQPATSSTSRAIGRRTLTIRAGRACRSMESACRPQARLLSEQSRPGQLVGTSVASPGRKAAGFGWIAERESLGPNQIEAVATDRPDHCAEQRETQLCLCMPKATSTAALR